MLRRADTQRSVVLAISRSVRVAIASAALCVGTALGAAVEAQVTQTQAAKAPSSFARPPGGIVGPNRKIDQAQPLYLTGDELVYDTRGNAVTARGNVEIYYNDFILTADLVTYDQAASTLTAVGNVQLRDPNGSITRAERLTLTDDFRDGFAQQLSVVARDDTRIAAARANRRDGDVTEFEQGKFTPCKSDPGKPPLWCISAARIIHDQRAATISYQDASFELFGIPIARLPFFQHADPSVKRKSGFLLPDITQSTTLGYTVEIPYYFALSPNYDFTFHPLTSSKQGILWQGDWRHRLRVGDINGQYEIKIAAIDQATGFANSQLGDNWRGSVATKSSFSLSSWWRFGWDVTVESDDSFRRFYKLDNIYQTDRVNSVYLIGLGERSYFSVNAYQLGGLLLTDTATSESRVHPVLDWNYVVGQPVPIIGGELSWNVNVLSFTRSQGALDKRQTSSIDRISADINWRRRLTDAIGITYTPFAQLRGDYYQLSDVVDPVTKLAIESDTTVRGVAAAGVLTAYPWVAHTERASHVVEPIGQIIGRTARVTQSSIPDEDARTLIFDDTNLFELDKFSGWDRVETGTRANVGLQYTFQQRNGWHARVLGGQSLHLSGENAFRRPGTDQDGNFAFNPKSGLADDASDYVLGAYLSPSSVFRLIGQARFSEDNFALQRGDAIAQVAYGPIFAQGIYSYSAFNNAPVTGGNSIRPLLDQQELVGILGLRLTDRWSLQAMMRYDLDDARRLQDQLSLRYADECFVLTATYTDTRTTNSSNIDLVPDQTVMLRFELKHLGEFKYKTNVLETYFAENQSQNRP